MPYKIQESYLVNSPEQATCLLNPMRTQILGLLSTPASASEIARNMKEIPQRVNYHLKALEKVGLVQMVGKRHVRNLVEVLYQSVAKSFILADSLGWDAETIKKIKDQSSLSHLVSLAETIKKDVLILMEKSDDKQEIPSANLQFQVNLESKEKRNSFVKDYVTAVKELINQYQVAPSETKEVYKVLLTIYPDTQQEETWIDDEKDN